MARNEVPSITTVEAPGTSFGAIERGMFVAEGKTRKVVPPTTTVDAPGRAVAGIFGSGIMVGVTKMNGIPFTVIVDPVSPGGAFDRGMEVAEGTKINGVLLMKVVRIGAAGGGDGAGIMGRFVELGTTKNGVLDMIVKLPVRPGGAKETGILVELGNTMKVVP